MNRLLHFLLGPELLWIVYYSIVALLIKLSHSPVKSMDSFWISMAYLIPLILLPLSFMLYYVPGVIRPWLLPRLWLAGVIGGHFVLSKALIAHSEQGPGVGTAYMMGMGILFFALIGCTIWTLIKF
jgi:hypothetical protein